MIWVLALGALHIAAGLVVAQRWFAGFNRTERLLVAGLTAYITFYMVPVGLGFTTSIMNGFNVAAGGLVAVTFAAVSWWRSRNLNHLETSVNHPKDSQPASVAKWIFSGLNLLILLAMLVICTQYPVRTWDAPSYHMSNPMSWHMTGRFILESFGDVSLSTQAMSAECAPNVKGVLPWIVMLFTKDIAGTALAQFPFFLLMLSATRAIALRLGTTGWVASLVTLAATAIPEAFLQAFEAYADLAFLSGCIVLLWLLIITWQQPLTWRTIVLPAVGFGLLSGAKASFLITGGVLGVFYGLMLTFKALRREGPRGLRWIGAGFALTLVAILFTGGPWYIHAWQKFANPFYPFEITVGKHVLFEGPYKPDVNSSLVKGFTGVSGYEALYNTIREKWAPPYLSNWSGGLGTGFFVYGLAAMFLFAIRGLWAGPGASARRILFVGALLLYTTTQEPAVARFSLYLPVISLLCTGWLVTIFPLIPRVIVSGIVLCVTAFQFYMNLGSVQYRRRSLHLVAFNIVSGYSAANVLDIYPEQYTALDYWKEEVSKPGYRLALPPTSVSVWFTYAPWSPAGMVRWRDPKDNAEATAWLRELQSAGATHYYALNTDPGFAVALSRPDLFELLFRGQPGQHHVTSIGFVPPWPDDALFRLRKEALP